MTADATNSDTYENTAKMAGPELNQALEGKTLGPVGSKVLPATSIKRVSVVVPIKKYAHKHTTAFG